MLGNGGCTALGVPAHTGLSDIDMDWCFTCHSKELEQSWRKKALGRSAFSHECRNGSVRHDSERYPETQKLDVPVRLERSVPPSGKVGGSGKAGGHDKSRTRANVQVNGSNSDHRFSRVEEGITTSAKDSGHVKFTGNSQHSSNFLQPLNLTPSSEERLSASAATPYRSSDVQTGYRHHCETPKKMVQDSDGEEWRSLARAITTDQKISAISNHDLMRVAELRFSSDMQDGDAGGHVALLQKALFWLGYLPQESDITGYFGAETKKALCEFQEAHGVHRTGSWGALSKQALWHNVSGEILHRAALEKTPVETAQKRGAAYAHGSLKSGTLVPPWLLWRSSKFTDAFSAYAEGDWKVLSGAAFLVVGILFGLLISRSSTKESKESAAKRRIIMMGENGSSTSQLLEDKQWGSQESLPKEALGVKISHKSHKTPMSSPEVGPASQSGPLRSFHKKSSEGSPSNLPWEEGMHHTSVTSSAPFRSGRKATSVANASLERFKSPKATSDSSQSIGKLASNAMGKDYQREKFSGSKAGFQKRQVEMSEEFGQSSLRDAVPATNRRKMTAIDSRKPENEHPAKQTNQDNNRESDQLEEDEVSIKKRIEELRKAVEAAELNGQAAVDALAEERRRSLELESKISKQREAAASLEEEVRFLKESHDALLASLREKLKSALATKGTSLLYRKFSHDNDGNGGS